MLFRALILLCVAALLCACASVGQPLRLDRVSQIQRGRSTEAEVVALLGPPTSKSLTSEGKVLMQWVYAVASAKAENFIPVVGMFAGGTNLRKQEISVLVGKDGKVENFTSNDSRSDVGLNASSGSVKP